MARIVLVGAGSSLFGFQSVLDALKITTLRGSNLVLHDIDNEKLKTITDLSEKMSAESCSPLKVEHTVNLSEALEGADYVILSIAVERMRRWRMDWEIPYKHGIKQVLGENGGPGGLFHTLRNIPLVLAIAREMEDQCPDALLLNYTDPVATLCLAVSKYTGIKVVGLCQGVEHQIQRLAPLIGVPRALISAVSAGLNHFSWFQELMLKDGTDAYPILKEALANSRGFQPLCRAMYDKFGLYPSTDDNHLGEYLAHAWEVCHPEDRGLDWIERCERDGEKIREMISRLTVDIGVTRVDDTLSGGRAMHIVSGIEGDSNHVELQVNMPNKGQVNNLMRDAIVETPAIISKKGVKPTRVSDLPDGLAALCNIQVIVQRLAVEAGVHGDVGLAHRAMMLDPVVQDELAAEKAFKELFEVHRDLLPQFKETP